MKSFFAFPSFALALLLPFSSAAPGLNEHPNIGPFTLRAITVRGATPVINGQLQIVGDAVVVGSTQYATDFTAYIHPSPKGKMRVKGHKDERFFLDPVSGHPTPGYHDLKFDHPVSAHCNFNGFFATGAGCGSHCGGPQVVYDQAPNDDEYKGNWFAYPRDNTIGENGYSIHWVAGDGVPKGHSLVYLMRESVPQE
ncbi:hypothetical protein AJ78_09021 [Emergomyces pasteurianus Ep9510]|uniref:Uncharacterized protein n=1 Tax=Emergomyces pasteurianus Ep9510 TaxID=1447872 RepID=A0A1J9NZP3_9EURO|nr:hypothetical protein AJ78_09021 [Emergomyces pasteurianus Ep9510]